MKRTEIKSLLELRDFGSEVIVKGWVRTKRGSKNVAFIALNDGSTINNVQIVVDVDDNTADVLDCIHTGAAISVSGKLVESSGSGQSVEVHADTIDVLGIANPDEYPLQPKKHSLEFLREKAHLRYRTNTFSAIARIRHKMIFAIHKFFNDRGFYNIHSPIITGSDAEGAGEMFQVTTLPLDNVPKNEDGEVDFGNDFFGKAANLTVSGQLEAELAALALSKVYTFGPTFRAENSNTTRHLAEFWMIEPEFAFGDIIDDMDLAEDMLKYVIEYALENCKDDLSFLSKRQADEEKNKKAEERSMELIEKLKFVINQPFERLTYTEAIDILRNSKPNKKKRFQYVIEGWGADLQSEHERYLVEKHFKKPVILTDYPASIKAFYMKQNDDGKTVRAMDILFPQIGEIIGGSQREEDYDKLHKRIKEMDIPEEEIWWYMETRKFGTVPHAGFGLGFERLILFLTGMGNIRDVIPFPRTPMNLEF
ncbi:MAG: asparagine--tRNA ligase [Lentimicrobiaceae bacterium]|nr:asparagine--tRNA ligase [Lentimicrobiaceae bacterium]MCP4911318.1 asparagine--tRNA ligase [Bacteroidota bacterium]MBT3454048.1 asparagine--tRNA ligase [Lentimicrobiaceae bacterium]MBT3819166.1 asparagine--tRNA ligase [Lentimicrobiaceae bacterium]MBT4060595.1 asparagine--tRNA ligase [Lentimicrobiaceae bacterium]